MVSDPLNYYALVIVVLIVQFCVPLYFVYWLHRALPDAVLKKYSRKVRFLCTLPVPVDWKKHIADDDISTFFRYREAFLLLNIFMLVSMLLEIVLIMLIGFGILTQSVR